MPNSSITWGRVPSRGFLATIVALAIMVTVGAALGSSREPRSPVAIPARSDTLRDAAVKRLAQIDGTIAVPGLDSTVEVRRDRWGVPHIYARTEHDLFF